MCQLTLSSEDPTNSVQCYWRHTPRLSRGCGFLSVFFKNREDTQGAPTGGGAHSASPPWICCRKMSFLSNGPVRVFPLDQKPRRRRSARETGKASSTKLVRSQMSWKTVALKWFCSAVSQGSACDGRNSRGTRRFTETEKIAFPSPYKPYLLQSFSLNPGATLEPRCDCTRVLAAV